jgi:hemerythrin
MPSSIDRVEWSDDLLVHVEAIDSDHRKLFDLMNGIFANAHHGPAAVNTAVGMLWSYTKEHFAREQDSMRGANYPKLPAHIEEHEHLVFQLENLINQLMDRGPDAVDESLAEFLKNWLCSHILKFDVEYATFLRETGQPG